MTAGVVRSTLNRCSGFSGAQMKSLTRVGLSPNVFCSRFVIPAITRSSRLFASVRELPDGWRAVYSADYGREYYWHESSGATSWELPASSSVFGHKPAESTADTTAHTAHCSPLPNGALDTVGSSGSSQSVQSCPAVVGTRSLDLEGSLTQHTDTSAASVAVEREQGKSVVSTNTGSDEKALCYIHGKMRFAHNLVANDQGQMVCMSGFECRQPTGRHRAGEFGAHLAVEKAMCRLHGKMRLAKLLREDEAGQMRCIAGHECVQNGEHCHTHGLRREVKDLQMNADGTWTCIPGNECTREAEASAPEASICHIHGKARAPDKLRPNAKGHMVCMPGGECDRLNSFDYCSLHNKRRARKFLRFDEQGNLVCFAGAHECATHLADGWQVAYSAEHGREYFWHVSTGATTWERPSATNDDAVAE